MSFSQPIDKNNLNYSKPQIHHALYNSQHCELENHIKSLSKSISQIISVENEPPNVSNNLIYNDNNDESEIDNQLNTSSYNQISKKITPQKLQNNNISLVKSKSKSKFDLFKTGARNLNTIEETIEDTSTEKKTLETVDISNLNRTPDNNLNKRINNIDISNNSNNVGDIDCDLILLDDFNFDKTSEKKKVENILKINTQDNPDFNNGFNIDNLDLFLQTENKLINKIEK